MPPAGLEPATGGLGNRVWEPFCCASRLPVRLLTWRADPAGVTGSQPDGLAVSAPRRERLPKARWHCTKSARTPPEPPRPTKAATRTPKLAIGYVARLHAVTGAEYFTRVLDTRAHAQVGFNGWQADYPSESGFLTGAVRFCDRSLDRLMTRASRVQIDYPPAARAL